MAADAGAMIGVCPPGVEAQIWAAFHEFDADGSGSIDLGELTSVMRALGADESHAKMVMAAADRGHDGAISFEEFASAVGPIYEQCPHSASNHGLVPLLFSPLTSARSSPRVDSSELALRRAFDVFDRDGNGAIDRHELQTMMAKLRLLPTDDPAALDRMFVLADVNKDGRITFDEFVRLFQAEPS